MALESPIPEALSNHQQPPAGAAVVHEERRSGWLATSVVVAVFALALLLLNPWMHGAMMDEWSTFLTARTLAATGHVHFNGWEAPIQGWVVFWGAAWIRLFGASYNVTRMSQMLLSVVTVSLLHRLLLLACRRPWLAAAGALTVALSPVFLANSVVFTTDVASLLALLACVYACARAVASADDAAATRWIVAAALLNAVLGTARQTAWLGLFAVVPAALWLLRARRLPFRAGLGAVAAGTLLVAATLLWFARQPYVLPETIWEGRFYLADVAGLFKMSAGLLCDTVLLLCPLTLLLLRRLRVAGAAVLAAVLALWAVHLHHLARAGMQTLALAPFALPAHDHWQAFESTWINDDGPFRGQPLHSLGDGLRGAATVIAMAASVAVLAACWRTLQGRRVTGAPVADSAAGPRALNTRAWLWLVLPTAVLTLGSMVPRSVQRGAFDRYLLPLMVIGALLLVRTLRSVRGRELWVAAALIAVVAGYGMTSVHDALATYRAGLVLDGELMAASVPRTAINGGNEFNRETEVDVAGYVSQAGIRLADGTRLPPQRPLGSVGPCGMDGYDSLVHVHARYALANPASPCVTADGFAPVEYTTWGAPRHRTARIVVATAGHAPEPGTPQPVR